MTYSRNILLILLIALPVHMSLAEPSQVVFKNGRSLPISYLSLEGDKFVMKVAAEGYTIGQIFPLASVDHIFGEKPAEINQAIALMLRGKAREARELVEPIVEKHRISAKIPGSFWPDAARVLLLTHAMSGDNGNVTTLSREISSVTGAQGVDPFQLLGNALLLPPTTKVEERLLAMRDLTADNLPSDVRAYASFFLGNILKKEKKTPEALEAYLSVPCLYPSGGLILNAAAELDAADILTILKRREEALALVQSALLASTGTLLADEANARLKSLQ